MHKPPFRPTAEVSQPFSSGVVKIYKVENIAVPGFKAKAELTQTETLFYEELRLGINRYYSGKQNQVEIECVIRTPRRESVSSQDIAITENGKQFRVDLVQLATDAYPPSMDLTLTRVEQEYEVPL